MAHFSFFGCRDTRIDINESDREIRIIAELPGLNEQDVRLEIANDVLSISGEKKSETSDKDRRFSELYYGSFQRRIALGDVDGDKASALFKDGVLTITVPKSQRAKEMFGASRSTAGADRSNTKQLSDWKSRFRPQRRSQGARHD
jgi:HSP20 family molecular chaperone IbpA